MRVLVDVSPAQQGYAIAIRLGSAEGELLAERTMPDPGAPAAEESAELIKRVEQDDLRENDVVLLGRYLFDLLLGAECWERIVAKARQLEQNVVELALRWDSDQVALHRPSWEAMHDGAYFLGDNPDLPVAITRIVADADRDDCPSSVPVPARLLFVVGARLNDRSIRRGAEIIGLLRGLEREDSSVDSKILESTKLEDLADACAHFKPHIIHFVGHGQFEGRGELQLSVERKGESGWVDGEQLMRAITKGESRPSVVLLTGCESAVAGDHMDSLASELVRRGVPIAIGMAGRVSDPVCRLFTRRFGMSLGKGECLVEAMTHGRRAGLQAERQGSANDRAWAMPSIYLAPCVSEGYVPIKVSGGSSIVDRVAGFGLDRRPVFYGRAQLGTHFERLLGPKGISVLIAYAENGDKLGKTRLQHEFARRALMAGHVVVMLDDVDDERSRLPQNSVQLAAALLNSIGKTRDAFGLPELFESALLHELELKLRRLDLESEKENLRLGRLEEFLVEAEQRTVHGYVLDGVLASALWADLKTLMADIHAQGDDAAERRLVLIFGGIGDWGSATEMLFARLIGKTDPGTRTPPFSLFATCSWAEENRDLLEAALDRADAKTWEQWVELKRFARCDQEDLLAYQWVLLHPWSHHKGGDMVYAPNPAEDDRWQESFRKRFDGIPGDFRKSEFYLVASVLKEFNAFVGANDERILEEYKER